MARILVSHALSFRSWPSRPNTPSTRHLLLAAPAAPAPRPSDRAGGLSSPARPRVGGRSAQKPLRAQFDRLRGPACGGECAQEEREEWEYVSDRHGSHGGGEEAHAEPGGLVVEPLRGTEDQSEDATTTSNSTVPLCGSTDSEGPCAYDTGGMRGHCVANKCSSRHITPIGRQGPKGDVCTGTGTTAAFLAPFAPEAAGVLVGIFLAIRVLARSG